MNGIKVDQDHIWGNRRANILPQKHRIESYEFKENYVDRWENDDYDAAGNNNDNGNEAGGENDFDDVLCHPHEGGGRRTDGRGGQKREASIRGSETRQELVEPKRNLLIDL